MVNLTPLPPQLVISHPPTLKCFGGFHSSIESFLHVDQYINYGYDNNYYEIHAKAYLRYIEWLRVNYNFPY